MTRQLCSLVLAGWLATGVMAAQQPGSAPEPGAAGGGQRDGGSSKKLEKRLAHITRRYKLTADQQSHIRSILENEQQDIQLVDADTFMSRGDRSEEISSVFEASQKKIAAILTDQQRHKFDVDEKRRAWMDGRLPEANPGPSLNGSW
jgi:Spy/CpxP family protein refolding chaperone